MPCHVASYLLHRQSIIFPQQCRMGLDSLTKPSRTRGKGPSNGLSTAYHVIRTLEIALSNPMNTVCFIQPIKLGNVGQS